MSKVNEMIIDKNRLEIQEIKSKLTEGKKKSPSAITERRDNFNISIISENGEKVNRFYCNLDKISYNYKAKDEISKIVTRLKNKNSVATLNSAELAKAVTSGYCFTTAQLHGKTEKDFISQQLLVVDIDNEENDLPIMSVNDAINILAENDIYYSFMYYSFSHTEEKPKFRIVCVLQEPITDPNTAKAVNKYFISLFPQADKSCYNLDRFYFGTNKGLATEVFYTTTPTPDIPVPVIESKPSTQTPPPSAADVEVNSPLNLHNKQQKVEKSEVKQVEKEEKEGYFDLTQEIKNFDLLAYVEQTTGTKGIQHGKDVLFNPCPICGHNDNFFIDTKRNLYKCHSNRNGTGGNIINYLMQVNNWERKVAREYFIYDIMKQDREKNKIQYRQSKLIENIKNQQRTMPKIAEFEFDEEFLPEYLYYDSKGKIKVHCAFLENYIKTHAHYIFVSDNAKETTQRYFYINGCYRLVSDEWIKSYIKSFIPLSLQKPKDVNETFALFVMSMDTKRREEINADENIINFKNGILHLDTMQLTPHNPKYLCTIQIPSNFVKDAQKPKEGHFERYINHLTENDRSKRSLILQFLGMSISNIKGYRPKKALFMVGKHDTGKSQIRSLAAHLVGSENNSGIDLEQLEARFGTSVIYGKRLVGSDDMSYLTISELKVFKILTGAGYINAEFKGENAFTYRFDGVLWFCCNKLPKFGGDKGDGVYNRMAVIECNNPVKEKDRHLLDKLLTEREYIVSLAIKELQKVTENNYEYIIPESSEKAKEQYKTENNSFLQFFEECTEPRPIGNICDSCTKKKFYDVYVAWCADNNNKHAETKQTVTKLLKDMGKDGEKIIKGNRYWSDFTLKLSTKKDYTKVYGYDNNMKL